MILVDGEKFPLGKKIEKFRRIRNVVFETVLGVCGLSLYMHGVLWLIAYLESHWPVIG